MTNLAELEVRRNKLVSYFSDIILLPTDHSLRLICRSAASVERVFLPIRPYPLSKKIKLELIVAPMTVSL